MLVGNVAMGLLVMFRSGSGLGSLLRRVADLDNLAPFASALDTFVAVLEEHSEIIVQGPVLVWDIALRILGKANSQLSHSLSVVLVRVGLSKG